MKHEMEDHKAKIDSNTNKIQINVQLPHLVCNIAEILDLSPRPPPNSVGTAWKARETGDEAVWCQNTA